MNVYVIVAGVSVVVLIILLVIFWPKSKNTDDEETKMKKKIESIKQQAGIVAAGNSNAAEKLYAQSVLTSFSSNPVSIDPTLLSTSKTLQFIGSSANVQLLALDVVNYSSKYGG